MNILSFIEHGDFLINEEVKLFNRLSEALKSLNVNFETFNESLGIPKNTILTCSRYGDFSQIYSLVFFLNDFGLEYINLYIPSQDNLAGKRRFSKFKTRMRYYSEGEYKLSEEIPIVHKYFLGDYSECDTKIPFGSEPIHISEFLSFSPQTVMNNFVKLKFYDKLKTYLEERQEEEWKKIEMENDEYYRDTVRDTIYHAFDGDTENYWNID